MSKEPTLPQGFRELDCWAEIWNFSDVAGRYAQRQRSTMEEMRTFYDAAVPRLEDMLDHLDDYSPYDLPEPERRLYRLLCGLCEVSAAIELLGVPYLVPPDGHDVEYTLGLETI